jgi:hypothetical protein
MTFTLSGFATRMFAAAAAVHEGDKAAMEAAAVIIEKKAKATFGSGDLVPNAAATIAIKGADSPGIETGRREIQSNTTATPTRPTSGPTTSKWFGLGTGHTKPAGRGEATILRGLSLA